MATAPRRIAPADVNSALGAAAPLPASALVGKDDVQTLTKKTTTLPRLKGSRADLVAELGLGVSVDVGAVVATAEGLSFRRQSGATAIADLAGFVPSGDITPEHFIAGATPPANTSIRTELIAADAYANSIGRPLNFRKDRTYYLGGAALSLLADAVGGGKIKRLSGGTGNFLRSGRAGQKFAVEIDQDFIGSGGAALLIQHDSVETLPEFVARNSPYQGVRMLDKQDVHLRGKVFDCYNKAVLVKADTANVYGLVVDMEIDCRAIGLLAVNGCLSIQGKADDETFVNDPAEIECGVYNPYVKVVGRMLESDSYTTTGVVVELRRGIWGARVDATTYGGLIAISFNDCYNSFLTYACYGSDQDGLEFRGSHGSVSIGTAGAGEGGIAPSCGIRLSLGERMQAYGAWTTKGSESGTADHPVWLNGAPDAILKGSVHRLDSGPEFLLVRGSANAIVSLKATAAEGATVERAATIDDRVIASGDDGIDVGGAGTCDGLVLDDCDFAETTYALFGYSNAPIRGVCQRGKTIFRNTGAFSSALTLIDYLTTGYGGGEMAMPLAPVGEYITTASLGGAAPGTVTPTADRVQIYQFCPRKTFTADLAAINCTTLQSGAAAKVVCYDSTPEGLPRALLFESGAMDCTTTGEKTAAISQTFLAGHVYWIGLKSTGGPSVTAWSSGSVPAVHGGSAVRTTAATLLSHTATYSSAAPATWTWTSADITSVAPVAIWLRRAA